MRALRFHEYGEPEDVLRLEDAEPPRPAPGQVRVAVQACGLNPADWALCGGLFAGNLPRGVGLEVAGTVDGLGAGVTGAEVGQAVFGPAPFTGPTAGAAEFAVLDTWFPRPPGLAPAVAAALPMAVETAYRSVDELGVTADSTVLVHGGGATVGFAAVQIARRRGARVITTAGPTRTDALRATGAQVTDYGDGMVERVRALAGGPVDLVLDAAPVSDVVPDLVRTVTDPGHVLTISNFADAEKVGARVSGRGGHLLRHEVLGEYARLAAEGSFTIPIAGVHPLDEWRTAVDLSRSRSPHGKLVLQVG